MTGWSMALAAALTWGLSGFLGGHTCRRIGVTPLLVVTQVSGLSVLLLVTVVLWANGDPPDPGLWRQAAPWAVVAGAAELVGFTALYCAMSSGPMGIAAPVAGLGVLVPVLFGLLTGVDPTSWQLCGLGLATAGLALLAADRGAATGRTVAAAVAAGVGFGVALVALAQAAQLDELAAGTLVKATTAPLVLAVWLVRRRRGAAIRPGAALGGPTGSRSGRWIGALPWVVAGIVAGGLDAVGNLFFALASTRTSLPAAAMIGSSDPVVTALLARWWIGERLSGRARCGTVATVVGAAVVSLG
ncbi:MAG: EamA family transporter [Nakamurella sp.]